MSERIRKRKRPKKAKKKLTKQQVRERAERRRAALNRYQQQNKIGGVIDEWRKMPTRDRDSSMHSYGGDFSLEVIVRVGPRLAEERHGFNWIYWGGDR